MIETRQLRYFVAVAEELHFGRAAERLGMAQSPLSQQIRQLERQLGAELVVRGHHVVGLTDAGRAFLSAAAAVLRDLDRAAELSRRAARGEVGAVCVGYVSDMTAEVVPLALRHFRDRFGGVDVDVHQGTTVALLGDLREGRVDVAFVRSPGLVEDLAYERLREEPLVAALPAGHALAGRAPRLAELGDERFVVPSWATAQGLRRDIDAAFAAAGFTPRIVRESSPLTAVLLLVAARVGVALVPATFERGYPVPGVAYVELTGPPLTSAGLAWRPGEPSRVVANFIETVRSLPPDAL